MTIGNSVTSIGGKAFESCKSLKSITIPNSVKSIGDNAFKDCSLLDVVTIGNSVTTIGKYAFYHCSINSIYCHATTPPAIADENAFMGKFDIYDVIYDATLYVPCESLSDYQIHDVWGLLSCQCIQEDENIESSVENIYSQSPMTHHHKTIHNGQLLIICDDKTYNVKGVAVE